MRLLKSIAVVVGILVLVAIVAHADPCADDPANGARVDITIDWEAGTITADPESVEISLSEGKGKVNRVCWIITGLEQGQTLSIEGKAGQENLFPSLERTIKGPKTTANSGKPSKAGSWSYELTAVVDGTGTKIVLDPQIIINP